MAYITDAMREYKKDIFNKSIKNRKANDAHRVRKSRKVDGIYVEQDVIVPEKEKYDSLDEMIENNDVSIIFDRYGHDFFRSPIDLFILLGKDKEQLDDELISYFTTKIALAHQDHTDPLLQMFKEVDDAFAEGSITENVVQEAKAAIKRGFEKFDAVMPKDKAINEHYSREYDSYAREWDSIIQEVEDIRSGKLKDKKAEFHLTNMLEFFIYNKLLESVPAAKDLLSGKINPRDIKLTREQFIETQKKIHNIN